MGQRAQTRGSPIEYDDFRYDAYEGDDDAYLGYDHDDTVEDDEDVPEELNTSYNQCEEAYLGYLEARKRMRDLANARGFYPIVALADDQHPRATAPRSRGKDGKKGKGRGKGKGKGAARPGGTAKGAAKGRGKGQGGRGHRLAYRPPGASVPRPAPAGATFSGSAQQHGPRFKRVRAGGGVRPVGPSTATTEDADVCEEVLMVNVKKNEQHDETVTIIDTIDHAMLTEAGVGIEDSGCTTPVMGTLTWNEWLRELHRLGVRDEIKFHRCHRVFKFGNDSVLNATKQVEFPVVFGGQERTLSVCLVPGRTPLLLARGLMAEWGLVQNYRDNTVFYLDQPHLGWQPVQQSAKGHYVFNLLDGLKSRKQPVAFFIGDAEDTVNDNRDDSDNDNLDSVFFLTDYTEPNSPDDDIVELCKQDKSRFR